MQTRRSGIVLAAGLLALTALLTVSGLVRGSDMDERIVETFKKTYVYEKYFKDDAIMVRSTNGDVTLTGTVAFDSHKSLAGETAANLPGVERVDNQLVSKAERAAENSDDWINNQVRTKLLFHRNVSASNSQIDVKDGVVTLKGEAETESQKELTAEYARDVDGVKAVKNEITVSAPTTMPIEHLRQKIDDASVTAQVKMTLMTHRSTSVRRTKVTTRDGIVTLSGTAMNDAEIDLATQLASDVDGVKDVVNNMTVESAVAK